MNEWLWGQIALAVMTLPPALYGLHRLALRLERLGYIDYLKVAPRSNIAGCLAPFQTAIEPPSKHVYEIQDQRRGDETDRDGSPPSP